MLESCFIPPSRGQAGAQAAPVVNEGELGGEGDALDNQLQWMMEINVDDENAFENLFQIHPEGWINADNQAMPVDGGLNGEDAAEDGGQDNEVEVGVEDYMDQGGYVDVPPLHQLEADPIGIEVPEAAAEATAGVSASDHDSCATPSPWMRHLHRLTSLQSLELCGCHTMRDYDCVLLSQSLESVGGVPNLTLRDCSRVTGFSLRLLASRWGRLRCLTLAGSPLIEAREVIRLIVGSPKLERLCLESCAPVSPDQCNLIMHRFIAAGRRDLDISCIDAHHYW